MSSMGRKSIPPKTVLGTKLRRYRKAVGLTQVELAKKMGIAASDVSRVETGKTKDPGWGFIESAATALRIPTDYLRTIATQEAITESLQSFLRSELANGVTDEEKLRLRGVGWPLDPPTKKGWVYMLEAVRDTVRSQKKEG